MEIFEENFELFQIRDECLKNEMYKIANEILTFKSKNKFSFEVNPCILIANNFRK